MRLAIRVVVFAVPALLVYLGSIVYIGLMAKPAHADVAIVLGNEVMASGRPSPRLCARLNRAYQVYAEKWCGHIIVSGGTSKSGFDEATAMHDYLVGNGVPDAVIITDSKGVDTRATARNAAAIMAEHGWHTAIAVSQYFHIARIELACRQAGVSLTGAATPIYFEWRDWYSIPREALALPYYAVRDLFSADGAA